MENTQFDLVVIGSGPGGYVGAIRAAQLKLKVALVEKDPGFGGTCLNVGCIPSKALLDSSEAFYNAKHHFQDHGIETGDVTLNLEKMMQRKQKIVGNLTEGIKGLLKRNKVQTFHGFGSIKSRHEVEVKSDSGETQVLKAHNILLATGSVPIELPFLKFNGSTVVSSTEALCFSEVPKKMAVIGAGAIGLELGSVWARLGAEVTVFELLPQILPGADKRISAVLQQSLQKQGLHFSLETKVQGYEELENGVKLTGLDGKGQNFEYTADKVLVAVGRRPYTEGLGLKEVHIHAAERGSIPVNEKFQTSVTNVYAIGDLIHGPMLAHKAEDEAVAAVNIISGRYGHLNYDAIPGVVYTWPEVAFVGKTEEQLKAENCEYNVGSFNFRANGRAICMDAADGLIKVIADKKTDRLLGVHIVGPWASDLIAEAVTVMEFGGSAEDIAMTMHAHPTLSEALKEAALDVSKQAIHKA